MLAVGGAVTLAVAAPLGVYTAALPPDPCATAGQEVGTIWTPEVAVEIGRIVAAQDETFGAELAENVTNELGTYAKQWAEMARRSCEATQDGEQSEATAERRTTCLDTRLGELEGTLGLLHGRHAELLEDAPIALHVLRPVARCADPEGVPL